MGIPIVFVLIIAVWCPLLIYSFLNQTGEIVKPEYATLTASIEGYPVWFKTEKIYNLKL